MNYFVCPVCGAPLHREDRRACCAQGHSFDFARAGYVNLLLSQSSRVHGDDRLMVAARREFLDAGYYRPLLHALLAAVDSLDLGCNPVVLDAGCGECWYTARLHDHLRETGRTPVTLGVDLSKNALAAGAKRCRALQLAVGSAFHLPVADASCDLILSLFAPCSPQDTRRALRPGGHLLRAFPLEEHLWSLKAAVYDIPRLNPPEDPALEGLSLQDCREVRGSIRLGSTRDILNLFAMTPYYYKTALRDREKLEHLNELVTEIAFGVALYSSGC